MGGKSSKPGGLNNQLESKLQSILSTTDSFKQQLSTLTSLGEKLSSEVEDLKSSMPLSPHTLSPGAHGIKRSLGSDTDKHAFAPPPPKKPNLKKEKSADDNVDYRTGLRFNEGEGLVVYTNGAYSCSGKKGARAGIGVYFAPGDSRNLSERLPGRPTEIRAAIHAARRAVEQARVYGVRNLVLHTDSQFLIDSVTTSIKGWKKNDWVTPTGEEVVNKDDLMSLDLVIKDMNIKWVCAKGHSDIPGNKAADKLAKRGFTKSLQIDDYSNLLTTVYLPDGFIPPSAPPYSVTSDDSGCCGGVPPCM